MEPTRRWWTAVGTGGVLLGLTVLTGRVGPLYGGAAVAAWLIGTTVYSATWFRTAAGDLDVEVDLSTTATQIDRTAHATLRLTRSSGDGRVRGTLRLPPGLTLTGGDPTAAIDTGDRRATTTVDVDLSVVGSFDLPQPRVTLCDPFGFYTQTLHSGSVPSIEVAARAPRSLHVGQGGDTVVGAFGEHEGDGSGPGVTTRELREYTPDDAADTIDWKATARLGDVYVRETEAETDRRTAVVFDHRERMATGTNGETMLAYAREACQALTRYAADAGDPLGLWTVGDDGITNVVSPGSSGDTYSRILERLNKTAPTDESPTELAHSPSTARQVADRLAGENSEFARTLRPYVETTAPYVERIRDDPLVETVRRVRQQQGTDAWIVLSTSDSDPVRLKEAVQLASQGGGHTIVFLTPEALYEPGGLTDTERIYDRYVSFEDLRRELDAYPRVTAFEVAPGDRLDAVLSAREGRAA